MVSGEWVQGISTPPTCRLLESGEAGDLFPDIGTSLDGNAFTKEFAGASLAGASLAGGETPDPQEEYSVECTVVQDTGKTVSEAAFVEGSFAL